jgi:hypothetical protein
MTTPRPIDWDAVARHLCDLVTKSPTADDFTLSPPPPDDFADTARGVSDRAAPEPGVP